MIFFKRHKEKAENETEKKNNSFENTDIEIIRSKRKTVMLEVTREAKVILRAPVYMDDEDIQKFIEEKSEWLETNLKRMKEKYDPATSKSLFKDYPPEKIEELMEDARIYIPVRVRHFAEVMGVKYGRITIRYQKSRWGSCSSLGNLNFNCLLMLCPQDVIDYVVVHELAHLKELNHSKAFWSVVEQVLPEYKELRGWLKERS